MTQSDRMELLTKAVAEYGQAAVARKLKYSASAVNQILKGKYAGNTDKLLQKVAEVYGADTVQCPVMGEIALSKCADERRKPFAPSSPQRAKLWRACKECEQRG